MLSLRLISSHRRSLPGHRYIAGFLIPVVLILWVGVFSGIVYAGTNPYTFETLAGEIAQNNTEIQQQQLAMELSNSDLLQAKAGRAPEISATVTGTYLFFPQEPIVVYPDDLLGQITWPQGFEPTSSGGPVTLYEGQEPTYYQFGISVTQPLYTWGKITTAIALYEKLVTVQQLRLDQLLSEKRGELKIRLGTHYWLSEIQSRLVKQQELSTRLVDIVEQNFNNGFIVYAEVLSARIKAKEVGIAISRIEDQLQRNLSALERLTGMQNISGSSLSYIPDISPIVSEFQDTPESLETYLQRGTGAERKNIQILTLLKQVQELSLTIDKASVYWKPDIALQIDVGYNGSRFPLLETDWFRQNSTSLNMTIAVKTTLWDGGKKLTDITVGKQKLQEAVIQLEDARSAIAQQIKENYLQLSLSGDILEYNSLRSDNAAAQIAYRKTQFTNGAGTEVELLQEQMAAYTIDIERFQEYITLWQAYQTLQILLQ